MLVLQKFTGEQEKTKKGIMEYYKFSLDIKLRKFLNPDLLYIKNMNFFPR